MSVKKNSGFEDIDFIGGDDTPEGKEHRMLDGFLLDIGDRSHPDDGTGRLLEHSMGQSGWYVPFSI